MKRHTILLLLIVLLGAWHTDATAFWGSGSKDSPSGLNVAAGFDVNTITTLAGSALTPPTRTGSEQHAELQLASARGTVTVILGPWWYWEKQAITIQKDQELSITGSLAQGKDGVLYLFAQRVENRSNGETITLRSESGVPLWSHSGAGNQNSGHVGSGSHSWGGSRGGGTRGGRR